MTGALIKSAHLNTDRHRGNTVWRDTGWTSRKDEGWD